MLRRQSATSPKIPLLLLSPSLKELQIQRQRLLSLRSKLSHCSVSVITMAPRRSQDIYGYYRKEAVNFEINLDQTPVWLPWLHTQDDFEPYIYNAIEADSEIRLIALLPPTRQDTPESDFIRCRISTYTLVSAPAYEAISHYWGTTHRYVTISVSARPDGSDDAALYVTPPLAMALRRLRLVSKSRLI